jgi:hypothetical protein
VKKIQKMEYAVEAEYHALGPVTASASTNGELVVIDFLSVNDHTKALRLVIPASQTQNCIAAIFEIQKALADPASGIHLPPESTH